MPARVEQAADRRPLGDAEQASEACAELELELTELKAAYEQYFLGLERVAPTKRHEALKKRVASLKGQFLRQTALKFRVQTLGARLSTYERLWERSKAEIEAGTYRRDVFRARRHRPPTKAAVAPPRPAEELPDEGHDEALSDAAASAPTPVPAPAVVAAVEAAPPLSSPGTLQRVPPFPGARSSVASPTPVPSAPSRPIVTPPFGAVPPRPAVAGPPLASAAGAVPGGLTDQKIKAIYEAYVMAKKRCGEDTRSLTLDAVASSLKKQVPELMKQHKARSVEFKVVIKDGRAVLRALPRDS